MLLIAGTADGSALRQTLESPEGGAVRVMTLDALPNSRDRLREPEFDVVLLDLDVLDHSETDIEGRLRELAGSAQLVAIGGDPVRLEAAAPVADELISKANPAAAVAVCVRGAIERRRLRKELEESEARFRNIIERSADGIVVVDQARRIEFVNPAAERMFGRGAADLLGGDFGFAVLAGETTEIDIVRSGGNQALIAELRVSRTAWNGEPAQLVSLRDVTDRKRAEEQAQRLVLEQAAREQAERASQRSRFLAEAGAVLDSSLDPEPMFVGLARWIVPRMADWCVIDLRERDGIHRVASVHADPEKQPLLEQLTERFPPHPDAPMFSTRVFRSGDAELHRALDAESIRALAIDHEQARLLMQLGVRSSIIVPMPAHERCLGAITLACGERAFEEADLELAEEIASRAGRALENARLYEASLAANRAKSDFLAVISHELRTPLNAIFGYTDLLLAGISGDPDEMQKKYLEKIRSSGADLLEIIEQILAYAATETGRADVKPERIGLADLIQEVVTIAERLARDKGLEFRTHVPQPETLLVTDAEKLRQIILNLLTNAVKFTERGTVELSAEVSGDDLVIAISDTGIGIAPESVDVVFEPFSQGEAALTRHTGGLGLGASVSRRLAETLGGTITVASQPGVGSTFTVRVPARMELD